MEMALMNFHVVPRQSLRSWSGLPAVSPKFWLTGAAFIAVYFALNLLTEWHEFDRLGITLWSPDDGLALALLIESLAFAPFVFLGAVLVDVSVAGVHRGIGVSIAAELFVTLAYVGLAFILNNKLKFDVRQFRLPDVVAFLFLVPAGAALASFIYCAVLYLGGDLSADKLFVAMIHCWIGDALGIVTVIPAATAISIYLSTPRRTWSGQTLFTLFIFVLGVCLGFAALIGVGDRLHYLFNLLFLPVIWVAMREGYAGVALALVTIQLTLATITAFVGYDRLRHPPIADAGAFDHRVAARRRHDGAPGRRSAPARTTAGIGSYGVGRSRWRNGDGARSRSQSAVIDRDSLCARRAAVAPVECWERAGPGCVGNGGGRSSARSRGSGTHT
jgi:integral membrane sensor domain MASE1